MYILCIYCLLSIFVPFQTIIAGTPDDFWQEYKTAKQSGSVQNVVGHVKNLSTRLDSDAPERLESKKSAILWFMATGGKNGFRKTSATPAERLVLENALIFATVVHQITNSDELLPIIGIRRDVGIKTEDQMTKTHLLAAQRVITATRIMFQSSLKQEHLVSYAQQLFNREYIKLAFYARGVQTILMAHWVEEAQKFADILTLDFDRRAKFILNNISFEYNNPENYFGFKEPVTEAIASEFRHFVRMSCAPDPKLFGARAPERRKAPSSVATSAYRSFYVVTENGSTITRNADGSVCVVIGNLTMEAGEGVSYGNLRINKSQTEEEFLAAINVFSAIIEQTYI